MSRFIYSREAIPDNIFSKVLDYYLSGEILILEFSFTKRERGWANKNPHEAKKLLIGLLNRTARRQKVEFEVITTGSLGEMFGSDKQVHFHILLLMKNTSRDKVLGVRDSLVRRWERLGNGGRLPQSRTLLQGYASAELSDDYTNRFMSEAVGNQHFDKILYKVGYNLWLQKNNHLFAEAEGLELDKTYSSARARRNKTNQTKFNQNAPC